MSARDFGTTAAPVFDGDDASRCAHIAALLRESLGEDRAWPADLGPHTRLDADLVLDSLETAAFAAALREQHGDAVDLLTYIADLDLDAIITLTIADVARYVADRLAAGGDRSAPR